MAKLRSPNYPSLTLEEALKRARTVYDKEHTHPAAREVVAGALGYAGLNGASLAVIGTLVRYGLLEKVGKGNLKVSNDAVTALELDESHPQRLGALQRLAYATPVFVELRERFGAELPSDVNLKHFLIQQKNFLPKAADEVIRIYKENLELVTDESGPYDGGKDVKIGEKPPMQNVTKTRSEEIINTHREPGGGLRLETASSKYEFSFPLSLQRDIKATITISGSSELKRRDLEFLKRKVGDLLEGFDDDEAPRIIRETTESDTGEGELGI